MKLLPCLQISFAVALIKVFSGALAVPLSYMGQGHVELHQWPNHRITLKIVDGSLSSVNRRRFWKARERLNDLQQTPFDDGFVFCHKLHHLNHLIHRIDPTADMVFHPGCQQGSMMGSGPHVMGPSYDQGYYGEGYGHGAPAIPPPYYGRGTSSYLGGQGRSAFGRGTRRKVYRDAYGYEHDETKRGGILGIGGTKRSVIRDEYGRVVSQREKKRGLFGKSTKQVSRDASGLTHATTKKKGILGSKREGVVLDDQGNVVAQTREKKGLLGSKAERVDYDEYGNKITTTTKKTRGFFGIGAKTTTERRDEAGNVQKTTERRGLFGRSRKSKSKDAAGNKVEAKTTSGPLGNRTVYKSRDEMGNRSEMVERDNAFGHTIYQR